jgi:ferritin-like metal-binding protein YciE
MHITDLHQLLVHELQDLHSVETQILSALPMMIDAAHDTKLKEALRHHLQVTEEQLGRLNKIDEELGFIDEKMVCKGMEGIIKDGEKTLEHITDIPTRDAAIIVAAQRVEHYEMAGYGGAAHFARQLDFDTIADMLEKTLDEEKQADADLSKLAEGTLFTTGINEKAVEKEG